MTLDRCRVVLVRPHYAGNIGGAARVMRNFGLRELVLVEPQTDVHDRQAQQMSTQGQDILDHARIVDDFGSAVADCALVVATSARLGGLYRKQSLGSPRDTLPHVVETLAQGNRAALVFGPEPTGLSNADIARCHYLMHIATDAAYPALNLAQAVAISIYELSQAWHAGETAAVTAAEPAELATFAAQDRMFQELRTALQEIHFLYGDKADPLMHGIRHLLGKARLTKMEVQLLHGLARQIRWFSEQNRGQSNQVGIPPSEDATANSPEE